MSAADVRSSVYVFTCRHKYSKVQSQGYSSEPEYKYQDLVNSNSVNPNLQLIRTDTRVPRIFQWRGTPGNSNESLFTTVNSNYIAAPGLHCYSEIEVEI